MKGLIKRLLSLLIILVSIGSTVYSQTYISEINFINEEYLEIYSDKQIDFSEFNIYDDSGPTKNNSLSLIKNSSTKFYLFAGSSFTDVYDLSNFNCTIYQTSGSQLSNGGLKKGGENIILKNNTLNFSWNKQEDLLFAQNQSLHFDNNSHFINTNSICNLSKKDINNQYNPPQNNTNTSNINESSSCNNNFSIHIKPRNISQKIEFDFNINSSENISIQYWVENYEKEIIKNKIISKNTNTKSYTPTYTQPIIVQAILSQNNCDYASSKEAFYYKYVEKQEENSDTDVEEYELESYFNILKKEIKDNFLELSFELYRGDTNKRTLYISNNKKQQHTIEISEKYSKIKGKLHINLNYGENKIVFSGVDTFQELDYFSELNSQNVQEKVEPLAGDIKFFNLTQIENKIIKPIFISKEIEIFCNLYQKNTKVSNQVYGLFENGLKIIEHKINESKIRKSNNQTTIELKHTCKYKSPLLKSYTYETDKINISFFGKVNQEISNQKFLKIEENPVKKLNIEQYSIQKSLREKANIPIMLVISVLLISFLIIW